MRFILILLILLYTPLCLANRPYYYHNTHTTHTAHTHPFYHQKNTRRQSPVFTQHQTHRNSYGSILNIQPHYKNTVPHHTFLFAPMPSKALHARSGTHQAPLKKSSSFKISEAKSVHLKQAEEKTERQLTRFLDYIGDSFNSFLNAFFGI